MSLDSAISSLVSRLEAVTARLAVVEKQLSEGGGNTASSSFASEPTSSSASVQDYDDLINQYIRPFVDLSNKLGDKVVAEQASLFLEAVNAQKDHLVIASNSKKPSDEQKFFQPTSDLIQKIVALKESNRASKFSNNLSAISEGVPALGWVVVSPTPGPYVGDMRGGSEFYSNRLLKEFKGNNQVQVDWVTAFNTFLKELQAYIKKHHTTGLSWNPRGGEATAAAPKASSASSGGPPPPPGPPPPLMDFSAPSGGGGGAPDMSNVFSSISKGEAVTSGLRKVTDDMKTKNRKEKTSSVVPASSAKGGAAEHKAAKETTTKPPKFQLEGNKWIVEYQVGNKNIVISDVEPKQTCYIYRCSNSTIQIKGKLNNITIDDCSKVGVVFETVVSAFEAVNCKSIEIQVTGKVPSIAIDKTSGAQIYLSKSALETEIVTSKSSEMNVLIPGKSEDEDLIEIAIPEQYKSVVQNNKLVTEIVTHV